MEHFWMLHSSSTVGEKQRGQTMNVQGSVENREDTRPAQNAGINPTP